VIWNSRYSSELFKKLATAGEQAVPAVEEMIQILNAG
jgi:hypothetical protein